MTNAINNVPRELKPVLAMILNALDRDAADGKQARAEMAAELRALLSGPSPAGVDVCKGKSCGATDGVSHSAECFAEHERVYSCAGVDGLEVVAFLIGGEPSLTPCLVRGVVNDPLCRLSDAQAIIDGLRGEVAQLQSMLATVSKAGLRVRTERDQQAQRIGELEGLLRDERAYGPLGVSCQNGVVARCVCRMCRLRHIDAALSAGKEGE